MCKKTDWHSRQCLWLFPVIYEQALVVAVVIQLFNNPNDKTVFAAFERISTQRIKGSLNDCAAYSVCFFIMHKFEVGNFVLQFISNFILTECMSNKTIDNVQWLCSITSVDCELSSWYEKLKRIGGKVKNREGNSNEKESFLRQISKYFKFRKCKKSEWLPRSILSIAMTNWTYLTSYLSFKNMN